ncbi:MAG: helicase [Bacteroidia bacterium]|nr:MAG: helicase [Bacteroidia bacterium]
MVSTSQEADKQKELASRYINSTARHIFLTGKAGTGKTTFLKKIIHDTHKKAIVAAPTGIAAINAGGITLHSLFQLPFASFIPSDSGLVNLPITTEVKTPLSLIRGIKFFDAKRKLLRELELLIIDEVSMLRADILDAIDSILRHVRRQRKVPFGGVQMLFIGDLLQLPPVVGNGEWAVLKHFYPGMFFFNARVLKESPPVYIELDHIYRQTDQDFISLLNKLRDNRANAEELARLNRLVKPGFDPTHHEGYIFLTTHNYKAEQINKRAMQKIRKPEFTYDALVEGDFGEKLYPVEYTLRLKEGAQVMFIKNDHSGEKRYFNGKIGIIDSLGDDYINVRFEDGTPTVKVERYVWENKKYSVHQDTSQIVETLTGTFSHYPVKTAWAITIHKSQGLTFDKAVIDVSSAFAPGQIYVALSRLSGLNGLVLSEAIPSNPPKQETVLTEFASNRLSYNALQDSLEQDAKTYLNRELLRAYDLDELCDTVKWHVKSYNKDEARSVMQGFKPWADDLYADCLSLKVISDRFLKQLKHLIAAGDMADLQARVTKAGNYFKPELKKFSQRILDHIMNIHMMKGVKKYTSELRDLESTFFSKLQFLSKTDTLLKTIPANIEPTRKNTNDPQLNAERDKMLSEEVTNILATGKKRSSKSRKSISEQEKQAGKVKGHSAALSYGLYLKGKSIEDIAKERELSESTIMTHMIQYVQKGLLDVGLFLEKEKMSQILAASKAVNSTRLTDIMAVLGDEFTFTDVRLALAAKNSDDTESQDV